MAGSIDIIAQSFSSLRSLSGYAKRWRGSGHGDYRSRWKSGFLSCGRFTDTDVPRAQNYYRTNELTGRSGMNPNVSFEELHARPFRFRPLRSWLFFNWHQFVAALLGLTVEFRVKSLFARGVSLRPNARIVFHLLLDHRVEDDRDFMGGRRGGPCWS